MYRYKPSDNQSSKRKRTVSKITFAALVSAWLEEKKEMVKESTYVQYFRIANVHILPKFGEVPVRSITAKDINILLKEKYQAGRVDGTGGLSAKTIMDIRSVIIQIMDYARACEYSDADISHLYCPRQQLPAIEILSHAEQHRLEKELFTNIDEIKLGILLALYGGLRIGEICAVRWDDFNPESGTLRINKTMSRIQETDDTSAKRTKIVVEPPKTDKSNRIIPLPSFITKILSEYRKSPLAYILTGTDKYMEPRNFTKKYKLILKKAGLKNFTFHALRHTFATRCVENEFDPKSLSEILGHADVSITMQRYVHPTMELKRAQMERLQRIPPRSF